MGDTLLVDTNVLLWLIGDKAEQIPEPVIDALESTANTVLVSSISLWEIVIKRSIGKLRITDRWSATVSRLGFTPLPFTAAHAEAVAELPQVHRDPFDRALVAQARWEGATLITADARIRRYPVDTLWA